jgi:hypothetical protein
MKRVVDLSRGQEAGTCPWAFVDDLQTREPDLVTPELLLLSDQLLARIPEKWQDQAEYLRAILGDREHVELGLSDVPNKEDTFLVTGMLRTAEGDPLPFHQVVVMDEDPVEDDYLGCVLTDRLGRFELSFSAWSFRDIPVFGERLPDILLKVSAFADGGFVLRHTKRVKGDQVQETDDGRTHIQLGEIVPD